MSLRNELIGDSVLDAARDCLLRTEGRKVTLAEVARVAGVSRPTVYRRWTDMFEVTRALLTREVLEIIENVAGQGSLSRPTLDGLVDVIVEVVDAIRNNDLITILFREQRDIMAPYAFDRFGTSQQGMLALLSDAIAYGQEKSQVRPGDPKHLASMVLLISQSGIQSRGLVDSTLGEQWKPELRHAVAAYLRPVGR